MPAPAANSPSPGPLTVGEVLTRTTGYLAARGSPSARLDAELLLAQALGLTRLDLYTGHDRPLTGPERDAARALVARRGAREPMAYILGRRAFRGLEFEVNPDVLTPRPETELLVEWARELASPGARVLDWGTGSGAIAVSLACERPDLVVSALDQSPRALQVAARNALAAAAEVEFVQSDGFSAIGSRRFEVIVANPPYLSQAEWEEAPPELRYEPVEALVGGVRGDEVLATICAEATAYLAPRGWLITEIGESQGVRVSRLMAHAGYEEIAVRTDLSGHDRAVAGRRGSAVRGRNA